MTQEPFLLETIERAGEDEFMTRHLIEAEDRQMVKYHFHHTLKDWGYTDTQFDKHCLEGWRGLMTEIHSIKRLDPEEYEILDRHLPHWVIED